MGLSSFFVVVFCVATISCSPSNPLYIRLPAPSSLINRTISQVCGTFEGNSDLYGLGIRLGVYLQWISSWLVQTINPNGVMVTHDANSIFVFAIFIAMISATAQHNIKPIESYIMLLICFGYFFTILSLFGIRVQFSNPKDLSRLLNSLKPTSASLRSKAAELKKGWPRFGGGISWSKGRRKISLAIFLGIWKIFKIRVSFGIASYIRHSALSWSGVAWRIFIVGGLFGFNIWFWWSNFIPQWESINSPSCHGMIYFFGERSLKDKLITQFFKISSIILIIPAGFLASVLYTIVMALYRFTRDFIYRYIIIELFELVEPGAWDKLPDRKKRVFGLVLALTGGQGVNPGLAILDVILESVTDNKFWTLKKEEAPPFKDLVGGYIQLLSRGIEIESKALDIPKKRTQLGKQVICLCLLSHAITLTTMALFIFFIEATISGNKISGVYTISSTGQLIPFVIGIASFFAALRDLLLLWLRRRYPDWSAMKWEAIIGPGSYRVHLTRVAPNGEIESQPGPRGSSLQNENGVWN